MNGRRDFRSVLLDLARQRPELVHGAGRRSGEVNVTKLAGFLGVYQSTLQRVIAGEIRKPPITLINAMVQRFGISETEALGGTERAAPEYSPMAASVAARWDQLPAAMQAYLVRQIDLYEAFAEAQPGLAKLLFTAPTKANYREVERGIEKWQEQYRRRREREQP